MCMLIYGDVCVLWLFALQYPWVHLNEAEAVISHLAVSQNCEINLRDSGWWSSTDVEKSQSCLYQFFKSKQS